MPNSPLCYCYVIAGRSHQRRFAQGGGVEQTARKTPPQHPLTTRTANVNRRSGTCAAKCRRRSSTSCCWPGHCQLQSEIGSTCRIRRSSSGRATRYGHLHQCEGHAALPCQQTGVRTSQKSGIGEARVPPRSEPELVPSPQSRGMAY